MENLELMDEYRLRTLFDFKSHLGAYAKLKYTSDALLGGYRELDSLTRRKGTKRGIQKYTDQVVARVGDIADEIYSGIPESYERKFLYAEPRVIIESEMERLPYLIGLGYRGLFDKFDRDEVAQRIQPGDYFRNYAELSKHSAMIGVVLEPVHAGQSIEEARARVERELSRLALFLGVANYSADSFGLVQKLYVEVAYHKIESVV